MNKPIPIQEYQRIVGQAVMSRATTKQVDVMQPGAVASVMYSAGTARPVTNVALPTMPSEINRGAFSKVYGTSAEEKKK